MDAVFDFLRAALPWIAVGLLLAVLVARGTSKNKKEEQTGDYGTEGMCMGMCFGTAIGTSLGNNTGIGISLGMDYSQVSGHAFSKNLSRSSCLCLLPV